MAKILTDEQRHVATMKVIAMGRPVLSETDEAYGLPFGEHKLYAILDEELAAMQRALARERFCEEHEVSVKFSTSGEWFVANYLLYSAHKERKQAIDALMKAWEERKP